LVFSFLGWGFAELFLNRKLSFPVSRMWHCVDLPQIAPLFSRFGCLDREPGCELLGIGIELA
jgi:hypothetical protein